MFNKKRHSTTDQFHACAHSNGAGHKFWVMALGCMGVVYGDIGTSPLYSFREAAVRAAGAGHAPGLESVLGILSLILWVLMIIVTLKYVLLLLYADNKGEGGILTLTALAQRSLGAQAGFIIFFGLVGAALFYGDAAITPAISVLSAVEGMELVSPSFSKFVVPLSVAILIALFVLQKHGTQRVSALFGPVMTIWMVTIAAAGLPHIMAYPRVLLALNPYYAVAFVTHHGLSSLGVLGAVFLAVTGAEALYADLGHFGRKPIQMVWLNLVFPCLALNYLGQGALVLQKPEAMANPFFLLVPHSLLIPLVVLAGLATIIASQAVITGTYSLTRQAIQLGLLPRMEIRHTSDVHEGQIFMPRTNLLLMLAVLFLVLAFGGSDALASAYGIAVTGTMLTTSILAFIVIHKDWQCGKTFTLMLIVPFVIIEAIFLSANMTKLMDGGIVPLLFAGFMTMLMLIWVRGSRFLTLQTRARSVLMKDLVHTLDPQTLQRSAGTAIFLTGDSQSAPIALLQNIKHNKVLHDHNVIVTVVTSPIPRVSSMQRAVVSEPAPYAKSVVLYYGYMESPDVPRTLAQIPSLEGYLKEVSYFLGRRILVADGNQGLPRWQNHIFIGMTKAATNATDFFRLPPGKVVELGIKIAV